MVNHIAGTGDQLPQRPQETVQGKIFQPLERSSLRNDATRLLKARITSGELEVGRLYAIGEIANHMEVSPTPVREALLDLRSQGLVEVVRNRGFRVVELSDEDLDEIVEVRSMLEPASMARLALLKPAPDFLELRALSKRVENAAAEGDLIAFLTLDKDFHLGLLGMLGNVRLVKVVEQLRDQTRLSGLRRIAGSEGLVRSAREHDDLLDALEAADADVAEATMRTHLRHVSGLWSGRSEGRKLGVSPS